MRALSGDFPQETNTCVHARFASSVQLRTLRILGFVIWTRSFCMAWSRCIFVTSLVRLYVAIRLNPSRVTRKCLHPDRFCRSQVLFPYLQLPFPTQQSVFSHIPHRFDHLGNQSVLDSFDEYKNPARLFEFVRMRNSISNKCIFCSRLWGTRCLS